MAAPERINNMSKSVIGMPSKKEVSKIIKSEERKATINLLQDFAREDFVNPFEELARMKLQAKRLIKEFEKEK